MNEIEIKVLPKTNISIAKFVKAKDIDHTYFAHPETIKAMKKNIFTSNDLLQSDTTPCGHCQQLLHSGMWEYCPYCGRK